MNVYSNRVNKLMNKFLFIGKLSQLNEKYN